MSVILLITVNAGIGQTFYDGFTGTGVLNTGNGWSVHSGFGDVPIVSGSLTYTGFPASTGNKVNFNATVTADLNAAITIGAVNAAYYSVLINVIDNTHLTAAGDYFMHFGATSGTLVTTFGGKLGIKSSGTGYRLSIMNTSSGTFTDFLTDLVFGTTYLVVVKYDRSVSPTVARLWVNPSSFGGAEPTGFVENSSGTATFPTFASICLRNAANTPKAEIDEIRCGTTWASVTSLATPLTGIKTIKSSGGDYSSFASAIDDLNSNGVGTGGVTFNVDAGFTEIISSALSITATGTSANPIVFQKSGIGANPLITAYTTGTGTPGTAVQDGIWNLVGSDYITIDGIDLTDNPANTTNPSTMEYGFGFFKASVTNGCQYNTIKNCVVTLNRVNNAKVKQTTTNGIDSTCLTSNLESFEVSATSRGQPLFFVN